MKIELFGLLGLSFGTILTCAFFWVLGFDFDKRGVDAAIIFIIALVVSGACFVIARDEARSYYSRKRLEKFENETRK